MPPQEPPRGLPGGPGGVRAAPARQDPQLSGRVHPGGLSASHGMNLRPPLYHSLRWRWSSEINGTIQRLMLRVPGGCGLGYSAT